MARSCVRPCTPTQKTTWLPWPRASTGPGELTCEEWKVRGRVLVIKTTGPHTSTPHHIGRLVHHGRCGNSWCRCLCVAARQHSEINRALSMRHYRVQDVSLHERGHIPSLDSTVHSSSPAAAAAALSPSPPSPPPTARLPPQRVHPWDAIRLLHAEARSTAEWAGCAQLLLHLWQEAPPSDVPSGGGSHH